MGKSPKSQLDQRLSSKPSLQNHLSVRRKQPQQLSSSSSLPPPPSSSPTIGMEEEEHRSNSDEKEAKLPLSEVVSDCVKRWFTDTLKEAQTGDVNMQVLVAQMYFNGYGIPKDAQKGRLWMTRASKVRSSVWKVSNKRPGYNASDSDSDELIVNLD